MNPRIGIGWQAALYFLFSLPVAAQAEPLRLVSYNIWGAPIAGKQINSRAPKIGARLAESGADIIAVQEAFQGCLVGNQPAMVQKTARYPYQALGPSPKGLRCVSSGLQTLSKHPIIKKAWLRFTRCGGTDCFSAKGVLFTRIRHAVLGEIDVYNTHMNADDRYSGVRQSQVRQWIRMAQKYSGDHTRPVIVAGDLNATEDFPEIRELRSALELRDSYQEEILARGGDSIAVNGYTSDPSRSGNHANPKETPKRIDYILYRPASGKTAQVMKSKLSYDDHVWNGKALSDHFGITTDWEITPAAAVAPALSAK